MSGPDPCPICNGQRFLRYRGTLGELAPDALSPTNHRIGEHGNLYECAECGTIHQPSLPRGAALAALYREMHDDAYLAEERGRRRAAQRLLDMVGRYVPSGRLLDVGCGHGLLLDEARRRGYDVEGLEISTSAAAYARDVLGLRVLEHPLEEHRSEEGYAAVFMADVLEHLGDPVEGIRRCRELLRPGGVLCVVTPDPSSLTARVAGARWWGLLPAHTFLLPRPTLRELITAEGLLISDDVSFVRTFSAPYWLAGLSQRGGALAVAIDVLGRALPSSLDLSVSLRDERVVVAHRAEVQRAPRPLLVPRGKPRRVEAVLPATDSTAVISRAAREMPVDVADRALVVDDGSYDGTVQVALREGFDVVALPIQRGNGATQKMSYVRSLRDGADIVVLVPADVRFDPSTMARMVEPIEGGQADVVIGSRAEDPRGSGRGRSGWKRIGLRLLAAIESWALGRPACDHHTGYRAFSADFLRSIPFGRNSDGLAFDQELFAQIAALGPRVVELPIATPAVAEASTASLGTSLVYGLRTLGILLRFRLDRSGRLRWLVLRRPAARLEPWQPESTAAATPLESTPLGA